VCVFALIVGNHSITVSLVVKEKGADELAAQLWACTAEKRSFLRRRKESIWRARDCHSYTVPVGVDVAVVAIVGEGSVNAGFNTLAWGITCRCVLCVGLE
jgi:hypothetical protein